MTLGQFKRMEKTIQGLSSRWRYGSDSNALTIVDVLAVNDRVPVLLEEMTVTLAPPLTFCPLAIKP
jgi:hypothetical protein